MPAPPRKAGPIVTLIAGVVIAALAFGWIRSNTPSVPTAGVALSGTLVYAVDDRRGWSRLWTWDLATGEVRPGPEVREPLELVNADGAEAGLVGVTSRAPDGDLVGSLLRSLSPGSRATPLARGDLVSWGAQGTAVVSVKRGPIDGPCRRHLAIVTKTITPAIEERQFNETSCGDILSAGRDANTTYFTIERDDHVDIRYAGYGRTHPVLRDFALLSVSPASDLLVIPSEELSLRTLVPLPVRAAEDPAPRAVFGTALFYRGLSPRPKPYGIGSERLWIDRVLTWSRDSTSALIAGHLGVRIGIFEIRTGPGRHTAPPNYVGPIEGLTSATFADHHVGFVVTGGTISTYLDGRLTTLPIPDGAPAPDGPIVWVA
jgi:hypothetical protein